MRALVTSLTVLSALSLSTAAFAASSVTGTIKAVDTKVITLKDGERFMLPATFKDPGLKAGEKVKIAYTTMGKKHQATSVMIAK